MKWLISCLLAAIIIGALARTCLQERAKARRGEYIVQTIRYYEALEARLVAGDHEAMDELLNKLEEDGCPYNASEVAQAAIIGVSPGDSPAGAAAWIRRHRSELVFDKNKGKWLLPRP